MKTTSPLTVLPPHSNQPTIGSDSCLEIYEAQLEAHLPGLALQSEDTEAGLMLDSQWLL